MASEELTFKGSRVQWSVVRPAFDKNGNLMAGVLFGARYEGPVKGALAAITSLNEGRSTNNEYALLRAEKEAK